MNRLPAEWEPQSFVQFTFPHQESDWAYMYKEVVACFVHIIRTASKFQPVLVGCHNVQEVQSYFVEPTAHPVHVVSISSNDTWARDHGAITVLRNRKPVLMDFVFNGWGQKFEAGLDNQITASLFKRGLFPNTKLSVLDFVLEGGGIESDGKGTLLTTSECLLSPKRNPNYTKERIEIYLKEHLGPERVLWLDHGYLAGDDTDSHIDTLARFCDSGTIAYVQCLDESDEHFQALQEMERQLKSFQQIDGTPYKLMPLPWPTACFDDEGQRLPATYANFLILNNAVMVPTYGVPEDDAAILQIEKCFPNHQVIGVNCRPLIEQHGSLHCISMQYPKEVKLSIS